ncbi:MAG TPA: hypothetical protein VG425_08030 [Casimicrobiaceae bacterium]|nr:hypothetical protein [Casimicrobiaceae bacterium]
MNRNPIRRVSPLVLLAVLSLSSLIAYAQDEKPYTDGSVWSITMIRVKPGMFEAYMREILPLRKKVNEEAKKQGLLLSSHVLGGLSSGRDDFDVMILEEYKNWAAFDGLTEKYEAILGKLVGSEEKQVQLMTKRTDVREILGAKNMRELVIK